MLKHNTYNMKKLNNTIATLVLLPILQVVSTYNNIKKNNQYICRAADNKSVAVVWNLTSYIYK